MKRRILLSLACFGALAGPTMQQAVLLGLSPWDGPVVIALAMSAGIAVSAGALTVGERSAATIQAVAVVVFVDAAIGLRGLAGDIAALAPEVATVPAVVASLIIGLLGLTVAILRLTGPQAPTLLSSFLIASAVAAAIPAMPAPEPQTAAAGRPVLLHLILDSLQSPIAASPGLTPSPAVADAVDGLVAQGFRVDALSYTPSFRTTESLGRLFSGYFDRLAASGYRLEVFHRATPDLCHHAAVVRCDTSLSRPTKRVMRDLLHGTEPSTAVLAGATMLTRPGSLLNDALLVALGHRSPSLRFFSQPLEAKEVIERAMARAAAAPPGTAIIAHVMLPHHPFALDGDCRPVERPLADWVQQDNPTPDLVLRQRYFAAYNDQALCALRTVRSRLDPLDKAIILIHGDHGSRVLAHPPQPEDAPNPNVNGSMLAVRAPGIPAGLSREPALLEDRFRDTLDRVLGHGN